MKRILLLLMLTFTVALYAQKSYVVSRVVGKPEVRQNGQKHVLERGDKLADSDNLFIPHNAQLRIVDDADYNEYTIKTPGTGTVQKMVKKNSNSIIKQSKNYFASVTKGFVKSNHLGSTVRVVDPATVTREVVEYDSDELGTVGPQGNVGSGFRKRYEEFRLSAWRRYLEFVRKAWAEYRSEEPLRMPSEEEVAPVIIMDDGEEVSLDKDMVAEVKIEQEKPGNETASFMSVLGNLFKSKKKDKPAQPTPPQPTQEPEVKSKPINVEQVLVIETKEQVKPEPYIAPVPEKKTAATKMFKFTVYGTDYQVRLDDSHRFKLKGVDGDAVADALEMLSGGKYSNTLYDCMNLRDENHFSDWAYYLLLDNMTQQFLGKSNEATLLCAFLYSWSGYKMRLAYDDNRLFMLLACRHTIYNKPYFDVDGERFYIMSGNPTTMRVCRANLLNEQGLSLFIPEEQKFGMVETEQRTYVSKRYPEVKFTVHGNKNLIDFFNDYPSSTIGDNIMSRWAMYANTPLASETKDELYPQLKTLLEGQTEREKVSKLLNLIQTGFTYQFDDVVWGYDRPFFAEETLYYPYQDCEDRSILFSRLVRDLVGLPVLLVYYPGHLATAVGFNDTVEGDCIDFEDQRYIVCDPTYIGASVGKTMRGMDNKSATVILLQ